MEMNKLIRLSKSVLNNEEIEAVSKVLKNEYLGMGKQVLNFENELNAFFNSKTVCVNSGTAAIQLALQAVGVERGDEVLVQSLTYLATYQAISALGAIPVSCDILSDSFTIDLKDAKTKITSKTKVILPVHYASNPGNLDEIYEFAKIYDLRVVEDAAHAFGSSYKKNIIGSIGDVVCFSFDGIKNITSGEGGAVVTKNKEVIDYIKDARLLGIENDSSKRYENKRSWDFDVKNQGWRYHMSDIMASIGRIQLKKFPVFKDKRQKLSNLYLNKLSNIKNITLIKLDYTIIVPHIFVIRITNGYRDSIRNQLLDKGIQTGLHYKPNHLLSFYKTNFLLPNTEKLYSEILTLPLHPDLDFSDVDFISETIISLLKNCD
jgi:dTDP-4-amino-4,6-dideoxygalactose transaminase